MKHVMHLALCGIIMVSAITLTAALRQYQPRRAYPSGKLDQASRKAG
jgi:hypothetical protein